MSVHSTSATSTHVGLITPRSHAAQERLPLTPPGGVGLASDFRIAPALRRWLWRASRQAGASTRRARVQQAGQTGQAGGEGGQPCNLFLSERNIPAEDLVRLPVPPIQWAGQAADLAAS